MGLNAAESKKISRDKKMIFNIFIENNIITFYKISMTKNFKILRFL